MPQMTDKAKFFLNNAMDGLVKTTGFTVGGSIMGFAGSLAIYMFSQVGKIFQGFFMGDSPETEGFLKEFGQGLTNIPGIGILFKPFVFIIPYIDTGLVKASNWAISAINFTTRWMGGPDLMPIQHLGFFGWVGLLFPITFISGMKPIKNAMDAKQAYIDNLPKEWVDYLEQKAQGIAAIPPKSKLPELQGDAARTFSLYSIFKVIKTLTWCPALWILNKATGGMVPKPQWPKRYSKMSEVEKLKELTSRNPLQYWISVEFAAFALAWYSALLTNSEDEDAPSRYLRNFSILGAIWGGVATAVDYYDRIDKKFEENHQKEAKIALEQENQPDPQAKDKAKLDKAKNAKDKPDGDSSYESSYGSESEMDSEESLDAKHTKANKPGRKRK